MSEQFKVSRPSERVPIFQGDDIGRVQAAKREFEEAVFAAQAQQARRLGDAPPVADAAKAYDAVVAEAQERAVWVTVTALGGRRWRALLAACPPREGDEADAADGYDRDKFPNDLLEFFDADSGERTITEPDFKSRNDLVSWLDSLNDGNFSAIASAAVRVNTNSSPDPKASLTSRLGVGSAND